MAQDKKTREKLQSKYNEVKNTSVCCKAVTEIQNGRVNVQVIEAKTQNHRKKEKLRPQTQPCSRGIDERPSKSNPMLTSKSKIGNLPEPL